MIGVIDLEICNTGSVLNMLRKIGQEGKLVRAAADWTDCDRLILPGVGAYDAGVDSLHQNHLFEALQDEADKGDKLILGICLGMQLLAKGSEEGERSGLGLINGRLKRFSFPDNRLKVPHMGWNQVTIPDPHPLFEGLSVGARYYFVHSYFMECEETQVLGQTDYGSPFASAVKNKNVMGVQFHPEKSHRFGMQLLKNFTEMKESV